MNIKQLINDSERGYTVSEIAFETGLSESTVRRDMRQGHLTREEKDHYQLYPWLIARNMRVGGLPIKSKLWLDRHSYIGTETDPLHLQR